MTENPPLRILVFGAGALGTYIGGSLVLHGCQAVFVERPQAAEQVRQQGLRLQIHGQEHSIAQPLVASSLAEAMAQGPFDAALFALKSFDTKSAIEDMLPHRADIPPILCLQNGVENEMALANALGSDKVIPGTVTSAVGRRGVGDIVLERLRGMGVAAGHPISARLAQTLDLAGLNCQLFQNAASMKWSKLITNLLANASSAILDMPPAEIFAHAGLFALERKQLQETLTVMAKQNIGVVDLPGTPVRLLATGVRYLPSPILRPLLVKAVGKGRGEKMPSFHIDLHHGRGQSEVEYLNGAVVRYGAQLGVPTPANRLLTETLLALTRGQIPLNTYRRQPELLLKQYRNQ